MHDDVLFVNRRGFVRIPGLGTFYLALALADMPVGVREENDGRYLVSFLDLNLGYAARHQPFEQFPASPGRQNL